METEPEDRYPGTNVRADLEWPHLRDGGRTDGDVAVVTALHSTEPALENAATPDGYSAAHYSRFKLNHYANAGIGDIPGAKVFPLVFEQGGRMGKATKALLRLLAKRGEESGWAPKWFFYWSQAAKANAALMEGNYKKVVAVRRHNLRCADKRPWLARAKQRGRPPCTTKGPAAPRGMAFKPPPTQLWASHLQRVFRFGFVPNTRYAHAYTSLKPFYA